MQVGSNVVTPFDLAHNLSINAAEDKLFVTHSGGGSDKVTVYSLNPEPVFEETITVENNPFGLVYYTY